MRDGVAAVRLNRPERLNAIDEAMQTELRQMLANLAVDPAVRAVVLTPVAASARGSTGRDFGPSVPEATAPAADRMRFQENMAGLAEAISSIATARHRRGQRPVCWCGIRVVSCLADIRICSAAASFGRGYLARIVGRGRWA